MPLHAAFERMEPKAGKIHSVWAAAPIQRCQDTPEFRHVSRCRAGGAFFLTEFFQAAMQKRFDRRQSVWCLSTVFNHSSKVDGLQWDNLSDWASIHQYLDLVSDPLCQFAKWTEKRAPSRLANRRAKRLFVWQQRAGGRGSVKVGRGECAGWLSLARAPTPCTGVVRARP